MKIPILTFIYIIWMFFILNNCTFKREECNMLDCYNQLDVHIANIAERQNPQLVSYDSEAKKIRAKCTFPSNPDTCICRFMGISDAQVWKFILTLGTEQQDLTVSREDMKINIYSPNGEDCPAKCFRADYYWTEF